MQYRLAADHGLHVLLVQEKILVFGAFAEDADIAARRDLQPDLGRILRRHEGENGANSKRPRRQRQAKREQPAAP